MVKSDTQSFKIQPDESRTSLQIGLTKEDLKILRAPFADERLGVKVQSMNKERTRALLVLYLQHTDVQDRLEEVDPNWTTEVLQEEKHGDSIYVRLKLALKGVSRENVGEGNDPKGAYSDALKRCAMLFGVGRYLYDSPIVWVDYNESRDRFRQWSIEDYQRALKGQGQESKLSPLKPSSSASGTKKSQVRTREQLNRVLMNLYRPYLARFPSTQFVTLLTSRYNVGETRLMTVEQMEDLVQFMEEQLHAAESA